MKKILALICSIVMIVSLFTVTTSAATDGVTASLEFKGYETVGAATFAIVDLKVTIPDTLAPYVVNEPDYIESMTYSFSGQAVQGFGFEIPYVDGLTFVKARCSSTIGATITADSTNKMAKITMANTGGFEGYFSGDLTTIATLQYRVADTTATYTLAPTKATVKLYNWDNATDVDEDGAPDPTSIDIIEYLTADFTMTGTQVKPEEEEEPVYDEVENVTAIVPDTNPIEGDNVTYTSVAKFIGSLNLGDIKDALVGPEAELRSAGIKIGDAVKHTFDIAGEGTVEYKVLFWGITAEQANNLGMSTFYKVYDIVD